MRIIAGKHRGRRIELGKDTSGIRPTSDFARQGIFNILEHGKHGRPLEGARVLDLFCGTGAFGLEALSRGAGAVTFIDQSREALALARKNVETIKEISSSSFISADASRLTKSAQRYDLVFIDPPYFEKLIPKTLEALLSGDWLAHDALIIAEHDDKEEIALPQGLELLDTRRYGRAKMLLIRPNSAPKA